MLRKIELDLREGADIITIKPSLGNLDLICRIVDIESTVKPVSTRIWRI